MTALNILAKVIPGNRAGQGKAKHCDNNRDDFHRQALLSMGKIGGKKNFMPSVNISVGRPTTHLANPAQWHPNKLFIIQKA